METHVLAVPPRAPIPESRQKYVLWLRGVCGWDMPRRRPIPQTGLLRQYPHQPANGDFAIDHELRLKNDAGAA